MDIGQKIQTYRVKIGLSQEKLAEKLDVSRQAVSKWEMGQSLPEIDKIVALSKLFEITTDALLMEEISSKTKEDAEKALNRTFFYYCDKNNIEKAKELWEHGGINLSYEYAMNTALMQASRNGYAQITKWLLEIGAPKNTISRTGKTALSIAEEYNHPEIITLLKVYQGQEE